MSKICIPCHGSGSITSINFGRISCFECRTCNGSGKESVHKTTILSAEVELHDKPRYIAWYGGRCPVDSDQPVEIVLTSSDTNTGTAGFFTWLKIGRIDDIIAYRVIEQENEQ
jgi:hypothetical protein